MTFTLEDAIHHEKEMAESGYGSSSRANEHRQIAIWLEELEEKRKRLKAINIEPLTDKEKRIFLAAMERERKICKQEGEELVCICSKIERKVKGALWK